MKRSKSSFAGFNMFSKDIGIDLGTANTLVYIKDVGIVERHPSVVAINRKTKQILAMGNEAKEMIGRTPSDIHAIRPMKDGVIADFDVTQEMLRLIIQKSNAKGLLGRLKVIVCVPSGVTEVERRAVIEASLQAGAKEVYLIEEPMAAAIGSGLPVEEPSGSMVVDIGGGTSEVAVISLGGIVISKSLRVGGDEFDESIVTHIKKEHLLMIGERTAEEIKVSIGSAYPTPKEDTMEIRGRDLTTGLPRTLAITSTEISRALSEPIYAIIESIKSTLEQTPPELAADIMDRGIMLTGGGALLKGLDKLIKDQTGMPVIIAENPLDCVALGAGQALQQIDILKSILITDKKQKRW